MNTNNSFLKIDCATMIASRYVDGKYSGERVKIDMQSEETQKQTLLSIDYFRLKGFEK